MSTIFIKLECNINIANYIILLSIFMISCTEVDQDVRLAWCPSAGCETVCSVSPGPSRVSCPTCRQEFCSLCRGPWHPSGPCPQAIPGPPGIPFDSELIKCCPMCAVPIEKDEGCAQMMCKRCKHVFCWYCLASLDVSYFIYLFYLTYFM